MNSFTNTAATLLHTQNITKPHKHHHSKHSLPIIKASFTPHEGVTNRRNFVISSALATSLALALHGAPLAMAENWGTHSFLKERFLMPGLSSEDAVARLKQTAEGLHSIRDMLEHMAWRYVIFYIRLKQQYIKQDLKTALSTLPQGRRKEYVRKANELIDNMAEFDHYVRLPKIYESYVFYEKTLKSIDDIVEMLA